MSLTQLQAKRNWKPTKASILIVDDDQRNLLTHEEVLRPLEQEIHCAKSGKDALKLILKHDFAVVILDVKMPDIDGYQVANLMRQRKETKETPIIFVTGYNSGDYGMFKGYEIGAVDYLLKPVEPKVLYSKVKVFVDLHLKTIALEKQTELAIHELQKNMYLYKTNRALEIAKKEAEEFASIASHDLQTPLRQISTYVDALSANLGDNSTTEQQHALDVIKTGTQNMKVLIRDLLEVSKIGFSPTHGEPIKINALVEKVIASMRVEIDYAGAKIKVADLPKSAFIDKSKIYLVLQNLIDNALAFRNPNRQLVINVSGNLHENVLEIQVSDNGIGIDAQHFKEIFQIFQQVGPKNQATGSGIGLSVCKKIVEMHGGEIWVQSKPSIGSTFIFRISQLPAQAPTHEAQHKKNSQHPFTY